MWRITLVGATVDWSFLSSVFLQNLKSDYTFPIEPIVPKVVVGKVFSLEKNVHLNTISAWIVIFR